MHHVEFTVGKSLVNDLMPLLFDYLVLSFYPHSFLDSINQYFFLIYSQC